MNAEEYKWIGIINPGDVKPEVTFITPLAYFVDGMWKSIVLDARRQWFPNSGKATILVKDFPSSKIGRLWLFHPVRNTQLVTPNVYGYSYYTLSGELEPAPLAQIIDWTARANDSYDLIDLLDPGIEAKDCFCQRLYIYSHSRLYGPIRLELNANRFKPHEYLQNSSLEEQTLFVWIYTMPEDGFLNMTNIHTQFTFLDESRLDTPIGKEDWSLPSVTIKRILEAGSTEMAGLEANVYIMDKLLHDLMHPGSKKFFALHLELATIKHAQYIVSNQIERLQDLHTFIEQLSSDHPLMKAARTWEIQARGQEIDFEAKSLIQSEQERLLRLQGTIEEAEAELNRLHIATDEARQRYEQAIETLNTFEQIAQKQLTSLKEEPLRILADIQLTASLLPLFHKESGPSTRENMTQTTHISPPIILHQSEQQKEVFVNNLDWGQNGSGTLNVSLREFQPFLNKAANQLNIRPSHVRICVAALLAGLIPAPTQEAAISALKGTSQATTNGRIVLVPVPVTALTTLDLFGTIDLHRQMFIPTSGGLADCILQAQAHPDELLLVVLEGIDRVPGMPVYVPLLRQYMEVRQDGDAAPINLFHPRAIASEDPYYKLAWFTWPRNVLLAATLDEDTHSLPLPSLCERWLVSFEVAKSQKATAPVKKLPSSCSSIFLHQWHIWEQEVRSQTTIRADLQERLDQRQQAFYTALTTLHVKDADNVVEKIWPEQFEEEREEVD